MRNRKVFSSGAAVAICPTIAVTSEQNGGIFIKKIRTNRIIFNKVIERCEIF